MHGLSLGPSTAQRAQSIHQHGCQSCIKLLPGLVTLFPLPREICFAVLCSCSALLIEKASALCTGPRESLCCELLPTKTTHLVSCRLSSCSFGKLHPALADKHYLRTSDENERIHDARLRLMQQQQSSGHAQTARPSTADGGRGRGGGSGNRNSWAALRQVGCLSDC